MTPTTLRPYLTYKPSDVAWLGDVPGHWEVKKIKNLARSDRKSFVDGDWIESPYIASDGIRLIQTGNIGIGEYREKGFRYISEETFMDLACTEFQPGDVLVCRLGEPVARACLAPRLGKRMITSVDVCILKPRDGVNARFVVYCMSSRQYLDWVGSLVRGSTRDRISRSMLGAFPMPLPPLPEQTAIVRYLDHVDRRIRRYVSTKRKLIALMEEEKQAVVSRAVIRGLDPNVRLKPSGVEWLGDVPEHWEVGSLKRFAARRPGAIKAGPFGSQLTAAEMTETGFKVYTQRNVIDRDLEKGFNHISSAKFHALRAFEVVPGDVLVTSRGTIGRTALVTEDCEPGVLHPCLLRIQPDHRHLLPEFLMTLIQDSQLLGRQLTFLSNATTIDVIYSTTLANITVPVPPLPEQTAIVEYLDKATVDIDAAITRARRLIELVQEYRTWLIADVVTGKVDVREAAAQLPDESDDEEPFDEDELAEDVDGSPYDAETAEAELTA